MERLEDASRSRPGQFDRLKGYLTGAEPTVAYRQVAADLGLSEGAVKTAVHRLRQDYGRLLREEIAATIADPGDLGPAGDLPKPTACIDVRACVNPEIGADLPPHKREITTRQRQRSIVTPYR